MRDRARERRNNFKGSRRQSWLRRAVPAREVPLPAAGPILDRKRQDKAGEYGTCRMTRDQTGDARHDTVHPGIMPNAARRKNILHVDAEMHAWGYAAFRDNFTLFPSTPATCFLSMK